jgi:DNA-binding MarR family transcriptional regulator
MRSSSNPSPSAAFLLAQVGAHAAKRFSESLAPLNLNPAQAGILRLLSHSSGLSQRALATKLGMHASRLVAIIDEMAALGLVVREGSADDRRTNSLHITEKAGKVLAEIGKIARQHGDGLLASLTDAERSTLAQLLARVADQQGLTHGVHPGYSSMTLPAPHG